MTDAERSVWQILRSLQIDGHRFRRQVPFGPYMPILFATTRARSSKLMVANTTNCPPPRQNGRAFWKTKAIEFCAFGTTRCCQTKACVRRSPGTYGVTPTLSRAHQGGGNAL